MLHMDYKTKYETPRWLITTWLRSWSSRQASGCRPNILVVNKDKKSVVVIELFGDKRIRKKYETGVDEISRLGYKSVNSNQILN